MKKEKFMKKFMEGYAVYCGTDITDFYNWCGVEALGNSLHEYIYKGGELPKKDKDYLKRKKQKVLDEALEARVKRMSFKERFKLFFA